MHAHTLIFFQYSLLLTTLPPCFHNCLSLMIWKTTYAFKNHRVYWHSYQHSFLSSIWICIYSPTFVLFLVEAEMPYARQLPKERRGCEYLCVCAHIEWTTNKVSTGKLLTTPCHGNIQTFLPPLTTYPCLLPICS